MQTSAKESKKKKTPVEKKESKSEEDAPQTKRSRGRPKGSNKPKPVRQLFLKSCISIRKQVLIQYFVLSQAKSSAVSRGRGRPKKTEQPAEESSAEENDNDTDE